jgi:hypothetical protein
MHITLERLITNKASDQWDNISFRNIPADCCCSLREGISSGNAKVVGHRIIESVIAHITALRQYLSRKINKK